MELAYNMINRRLLRLLKSKISQSNGRTALRANMYALGSNRVPVQLMGVPVGKTTVRIDTLSSFLAAMAGIVFSFYSSAGYSLAATGVELGRIAAVVIGTLVGVFIEGLIQTYITFEGTLSSRWAKIAIGALLFAFIVLQKGYRRHRSEQGRG